MKVDWKTIRRETGLVEHVCEHGCGHPNYGSALWLATDHGHEVSTWLSHGCCGCCKHEDFPGTPEKSLEHSLTPTLHHRTLLVTGERN